MKTKDIFYIFIYYFILVSFVNTQTQFQLVIVFCKALFFISIQLIEMFSYT